MSSSAPSGTVTVVRGGQLERAPDRLHRRHGHAHRASRDAHHQRGCPGESGEDEEAAPVDPRPRRFRIGEVGTGLSGLRGHRVVCLVPRRSDHGCPPPAQTTAQENEDERSDDGSEHRGQEGERGHRGAGHDRRGREHARDHQRDHAERRTHQLQDAGDRRGDEHRETESGQQRDLVVLAEGGDRELLEGLRHDVDHEPADREDRTGRSREQQREQLGRREEDATADHAREGGPDEESLATAALHHDRLLFHRVRCDPPLFGAETRSDVRIDAKALRQVRDAAR